MVFDSDSGIDEDLESGLLSSSTPGVVFSDVDSHFGVLTPLDSSDEEPGSRDIFEDSGLHADESESDSADFDWLIVQEELDLVDTSGDTTSVWDLDSHSSDSVEDVESGDDFFL